MNERVMQFRIGMFVIVAGLVLTMLIVWFGESPSLLRDHVYVAVRYAEAPGVAVGIPVRKSGIRIGEVHAVIFDETSEGADSVLVTMALERKYRVKKGTVARLSRSLIGDVAIDLQPGKGPELIAVGDSPVNAPRIDGDSALDPAKALTAATEAFKKVGDVLASIDRAANGIEGVTKQASNIGPFIETWRTTGQKAGDAAEDIDRFIKANEGEVGPAIARLRSVAQKVDEVLDEPTQGDAKQSVARLKSALAKLDDGLAELQPVFRDLGNPVNETATTTVGQGFARINRIAAEIGLLTRALSDGKGGLNRNGTIQRLVTDAEFHNNANRAVTAAADVFTNIRPVISQLRVFAEKIAQNPSSLTKGALRN